MKKLISMFMAVVITVSLQGCGQSATENDTATERKTRREIFELDYWNDAVTTGNAEIFINICNMQSNAACSVQDIIDMLGSIELGYDEEIPYFYTINHSSCGFILSNTDDGRQLYVDFVNDFRYAAVHYGNEEETKYYWFDSESFPQIREYFENCYGYIDTERYDDITGWLTKYLYENDFYTLAQNAETATYETKSGIPYGTAIKNIYSTSFVWLFRSESGEKEYYASCKVICETPSKDSCYRISFIINQIGDGYGDYEIEEITLKNADIAEYPYYADTQLAGIDYSTWIQKLNNPYHNGFYYCVGKGNGYGTSDSLKECADIMDCIRNLQLGEMADVGYDSYESNQIYTVALLEESGYYNDGQLNLLFYEDFKYVKICDCENESLVCKNDHHVYEVQNPDCVIPLFENNPNYPYVSTRDYNEVMEYVQKYMTETPVEKLKEVSGTELVFPEGCEYTGQPAFAEVYPYNAYPDKGGDFRITFTAMFKYPGESGNIYLSYKISMIVEKTFFGWKTTDMKIQMK